MKKKLLISAFLMLLAAMQLQAAVRTVNTNAPSPGQFTDLASAITASANNDTIYISGGSSVSTASLSKPLVLIGTGYNPDKQSPTITQLSAFLSSGCQGSKFVGLWFNASPSVQFLSTLTGNVNLEFINCRFRDWCTFNSSSISGLTFRGCVFSGSFSNEAFFGNVAMTLNVTAVNCVFAPATSSGINCVSNSNITLSGSLTNCQFQHTQSINFVANANGLTVANSIFYGVRPNIVGPTNTSTTARNCISFNNTNNAFNFTTLSSTLAGFNPLFTSISTSLPVYSFTDNYRLGASSPGRNFGTDGKDIGVYGGSFNFTMTGEPPTMPVIRTMNLGSSTVPQGTPLNVNVTSTIRN